MAENLSDLSVEKVRIVSSQTLVPMMRIERMTSPLPRECSTTELHGRPAFKLRVVLLLQHCGAGEGNRTLVISLEGFCSAIELHPPFDSAASFLTHPSIPPCARCSARRVPQRILRRRGGGGRIRTFEGVSQQIYSLPPLTAREPLRTKPAIIAVFSHAVKA